MPEGNWPSLDLGLCVFKVTLNNISVISWWSFLFVEEIGVLLRGKTTCLPYVTDNLYLTY